MNTLIGFEVFVKKCETTPGSATLKLSKLMKKEYVPFIEYLFLKGDLNPFVIDNILGILSITKTRISDDIVKIILDGIIRRENKYSAFLCYIPFYLIRFKKKEFCPKLKRILQTYGTKELLVDRTGSVLYPTIEAAKVLRCKSCLPEIRKIASYGTKLNGRVLVTAVEAVKRLDKL